MGKNIIKKIHSSINEHVNAAIIVQHNTHKNISIKENKEHHGYGLKSIRKTVEKYDGELVVEIRGNIFRAVAFMTCIDYV